MAALITSIVITTLMIAGVIGYGKRRPIDRQTSWGEAMLGSAFVFMLLLMVFGVVPDRWVRLTDNEWGWSVEKMPVHRWKPNNFPSNENGSQESF